MNLADKREKLEEKKKAYEVKQKELGELEVKVKAMNIEDEDYEEIKTSASTLLTDVTSLKESIDSLQGEITEEEKNLDNIAIVVKREKQLGGTKKLEYLKTKEAVKDFANILAKGMNGNDTRKEWESHLNGKGITNPEALLPQVLVTEINNALEASGSIYKSFDDTGLTMFKTMTDTQSDGNERARGHKKGTDKKEELITLTPKEIRAQYIYKYLTLDKETIREQQDTGALITYVMKELPQKVVSEIERAGIIGDGRTAGAEDKIDKFEAIIDADELYITKTNATSNFYEDIVKNLKGKIKAEGDKYLVMSTDSLSELTLAKDGNGSYIFPIGTDIAKALGVKEIFTPQWMDEVADTVKAVMYVGKAYKLVGDKDLSKYENFLLSKNKQEYLMETYKGGALAVPKSGAVLSVPSA